MEGEKQDCALCARERVCLVVSSLIERRGKCLETRMGNAIISDGIDLVFVFVIDT